MSKHTPGPWTFYRESIYDRGDFYAVKAPAPHYWVVPTLNINPADAHLIAAAPELLDALRGLVDWFDDETKTPRPAPLKKAYAAIAKAEEENT